MMADKKVERSVRERPLTPTQKMEAALSDPGTLNMSDPSRDKGKSALADKFREREERWRREQALHDQQAARAGEQASNEPTEQSGPEQAEPEERGEGGGS
jgi:hypothetical protein